MLCMNKVHSISRVSVTQWMKTKQRKSSTSNLREERRLANEEKARRFRATAMLNTKETGNNGYLRGKNER